MTAVDFGTIMWNLILCSYFAVLLYCMDFLSSRGLTAADVFSAYAECHCIRNLTDVNQCLTNLANTDQLQSVQNRGRSTY
jgi:hypothetical protein